MTEELIRIDSFFKNLEDKTIVRNSNDLSINKQYASVLIFPDTRQIEVPNLPSTTNDKKRKNNEEPPQKEDITFFTCYIVNSSEREDDKNDKVVRQVESSFLKFYRYIYDDTNIICLPYEYSILEVEIIIKIFILKYSVNTCTISQNYNKSSIIAADHSDSNKIPSVNIFIKPSNKVLDIENNIQYFYDESLKNIKVSDSLLRKNYDISHLEYYNSICNNSVFSVEKEKQKLMSNCKY